MSSDKAFGEIFITSQLELDPAIGAAALQVARCVYGGINPEGPEWEKCIETANALRGSIILSPFNKYDASREAFKECAEFNKKYPFQTKGVLTAPGGVEIRVDIAQPALVFPDPYGGEKVMAWFTNVGWRPAKDFVMKNDVATAAQELTMLGQQARQRGNVEVALHLFDAALEADPTYWHVLNEKGTLLNEQQRYPEALVAFTAALAINSSNGEVFNNRGMVYRNLGRPKEALDDCQEALRWLPGNGLIALNAASAYDDMGMVDECLQIVDDHIRRNPGNPNIQYNKAILMLGDGRFKEGWKQFEWRLNQPTAAGHYEHFDIPRWKGAPLDGKSVLIWPEQGLGDEIITASMVQDVIAAGAKVTLLATDRLVPLFRRSFPDATVGNRSGALTHITLQRTPLEPQFLPAAVRDGKFDYQMSQGDLGAAFRPDLESFPKHAGFLIADEYLSRMYRDMCERHDPNKKIVGISWHSQKNIRIGKLKTIGLRAFAPILKTPGVTFVNLQYGDCAAEIAEVEKEFGIKIMNFPDADPLRFMDRFSALVYAMDLVISVSNTTVHVAGGLGLPTWVMVPEGPARLWYWLRKRHDSLWYPSLQLYRQSASGIWSDTIAKVAKNLKMWVAKC